MGLFGKSRRTDESLVQELAEQEVDLYWLEGQMPEDADFDAYEANSKVYIQDTMTRDQVVSKIKEVRRNIRHLTE